MPVHTNVTYCSRQSLTIDCNQFPCCCSVRVKPSKESSVWVASSSLLVGTTTGSGCDYWQTTSHISTAPGLNTSASKCDINVPFTAILLHFHQWANVSLWKQSLFLLSAFVYCTGVVVLVSHSQCCKGLGEGFEKTHWALFKLGITQTVRSLRHLSVYSVTQACTRYIHIGIHHTNKLERTHHSQESNTCTRTALEPQQSAAVLTGATCCYCGLCREAGLLPALQPAATKWTQYPDSRSHGPQASGPPPPACLPACPVVSWAFNHSSFWLQRRPPPHPPFNANQCHAARMPHSEPVTGTQRTVPCVCGRKHKIRPTSPHYFLHHRSIDTSLLLLYFLLPLR